MHSSHCSISMSSDLNAADENGWTALIRAISEGNAEIAQMLINGGAGGCCHGWMGNVCVCTMHV